MTSSKNTKRALLASVLSVVLCCAMLVGSTFAWFTDSVTSGGNQIIAGNLKVDLIHVGGGRAGEEGIAEGDNVSLKDHPKHKIFNYDKWEPGYTLMETLKVVNKGNLAFKFRLDAVADGYTTGPTGEKLADVIDVYVYEGDGIPATASFADLTADDNWRKAGSLSTLMADPDGIARGVLLPENTTPTNGEPVKEVQMTVALHMQEDAGNAYQGLTLGDLNFTLMAAQYTYEEDSFGSDYDVNAVYPTAGLSAIQNAFKQNGLVVLGSDIAPDKDLIAQSRPIIDLNGKTIRFNNKTQNNGFGIKGNGLTSVITINGDGIVTSNPDGEPGSNEVEDGIVEGKQHGGYTVSATNKSKIIINGGHYVANVTAVYAIGGGKVEINGGFFDYIRFPGSTLKGKYLLNLKDNTNSSIVVKGGTFVNFDPSNNEAEGPNTNFVAEGYTVQSATQTNGDIWYTVVPA